MEPWSTQDRGLGASNIEVISDIAKYQSSLGNTVLRIGPDLVERNFFVATVTHKADGKPHLSVIPVGALRATQVYLGATKKILYQHKMTPDCASYDWQVDNHSSPGDNTASASESSFVTWCGTFVSLKCLNLTVREEFYWFAWDVYLPSWSQNPEFSDSRSSLKINARSSLNIAFFDPSLGVPNNFLSPRDKFLINRVFAQLNNRRL